MKNKDELFREAQSVRQAYEAAESETERDRLRARYKELDQQIRQFSASKSVAVTDRAQIDSPLTPNGSQGTPSIDSLLDAFPKQPSSHDSGLGNSFSKIYVLPLIVIGLLVIALGMNFIVVAGNTPAEVPTTLVSDTSLEDRVDQAEEFVAKAKKSWDAGFESSFFNDQSALKDSLREFKSAWRLLTDKEWERGKDAIKRNETVEVLYPSALALSLKDTILDRIPVLEAAMDWNLFNDW